jgi:hypothetical protein
MISRTNGGMIFFILMALSSLLLNACTPSTNASISLKQDMGVLQVDPVFREFYRALGAADTLGPAISNLLQKDNFQCQYTANALMCYNFDAADENQRYSLSPLGRSLDMRDEPNLGPAAQGERVVDGYTIYDEFLPMYDRMHGALYIGHPLTQVRANYNQRRIEQYFENVGFYRLLSEPRGQVHLIAYGAYTCKSDCQFTPSGESAVIGGEAAVEQRFLSPLMRIGGILVFGQPLTNPYIGKDGNIEQVYEKAVFFAPKDNPGAMRLRPAPLILGISFSLPGRKMDDSRMVFYPTQANLGFNVPRIFDNFIASHGGIEISGQPISEIGRVENENIYRQCFENYCLDYDPSASESLRIRLAPIGQNYLDYAHIPGQVVNRFVYSEETVLLSVNEQKPQINTNEAQQISVLVLQRKNQRPINKVEASLRVFLPDGKVLEKHIPPTDADGSASVTIPAQPSIQNGTVVPYQVCLNVPADKQICAQESYLVWNTQ